PTGDDHLIFEWVKMQGKTQREVAGMFGIDQSTVSRIIQRVERWQAHAKARENGRLDPQERLRAQRWLTYERNELILASCLRIAQEMEGFTGVSKSTITRPLGQPSRENEVRTQHATIDRSGIASRFLRLAFRINMEQLKLTAQIAKDGDAFPEPLSDDELAEEARQAAADAAELARARQRSREWAQSEVETHPTADEATKSSLPGSPLVTPYPEGPPSSPVDQPAADLRHSTLNLEPETSSSASALHNLHNENAPEFAATPTAPCTCTPQPAPEKNSPCSCITAKVGRSGPDRPELREDLLSPIPPVPMASADSHSVAAT
ncbi:MAG TPA: hypothetical protein VKH44_11365, partial [Pirellulaceae bacterium]|nr:hypothetical protein [Pirellulaceae bacterium]